MRRGGAFLTENVHGLEKTSFLFSLLSSARRSSKDTRILKVFFRIIGLNYQFPSRNLVLVPVVCLSLAASKENC